MRCRFCGSTALHAAEEHRNFSTGKAIAGTIVFGPTGAAAGMLGKKIQGYRCTQCGSFMESTMDCLTEREVNDAIYSAKSGRGFTMYNYYKTQYPNIETVTEDKHQAANIGKTELRRLSDSKSGFVFNEQSDSKVKRTYYYGLWSADCPVFIKTATISTIMGQDVLALEIINQTQKAIRSLYLQASVYDDAGDSLTAKTCVYQGVNVEAGKNFPDTTSFGLETDLAYRAEVYVEKVVFTDESIWRAEDKEDFINTNEPEEIDQDKFPRFKYLMHSYQELEIGRAHV